MASVARTHAGKQPCASLSQLSSKVVKDAVKCGEATPKETSNGACRLAPEAAERGLMGDGSGTWRKKKPLVVVTRRLPEVVETRMRELFDARLNADDKPMTP